MHLHIVTYGNTDTQPTQQHTQSYSERARDKARDGEGREGEWKE